MARGTEDRGQGGLLIVAAEGQAAHDGGVEDEVAARTEGHGARGAREGHHLEVSATQALFLAAGR